MTKKRILNVTSRKKQDNMLSTSNTSPATGGTRPVAIGSFVVPGNTFNGYSFSIWCATARDFSTGQDGANLVIDKADRTATTCYMRGLREVIRIQSNSPLPWVWRRICFTTKSPLFQVTLSTDTTPNVPYIPWYDTSTNNIGMTRQWFNFANNNTPKTQAFFNGYIFQGTEGSDWNNILNAKTDSTRIKVWSDTQIPLHTGNQSGYFKSHKRWYPMNKNLVYDDDENGAAELSSYTSTTAKPGMGDYYIIDIVVPGLGAAGTDLISFDSQATLYWHEK